PVSADHHADLIERGGVVVARQYTLALQEALHKGAKALLLADPLFYERAGAIRLPVGDVAPRAHTSWQGDWATSFSWLKKSGPFAMLPGDPILEMEYADLMPDAVVTGIPAWRYRDLSWAGLALGWVHKPVSLLAKLPYGRGTITLTTFNLSADSLTHHAIAQALMSGLVTLASGHHSETGFAAG
ncbi:MAG TPA: hypothetical protein PKE45_11260, partial [Caldilineaceae bacterium]|nr:hypothetical protein [Caldilineaceae bacterium]